MSASPGPPIGWNLPEGSNSTAGVGRQKHKKLKHKKSDKKKKHYNRSSSTTSSSSSSSSSSSNSGSDRHKKGHKYTKLKEIKDRAHKKHKKHKHRKGEKVAADGPDFGVPVHLMQSRANAPETQEAWQARQNVIRRVVDPSTGRERLIRGDGEILEEIVSRDRQRDINRQATASDGKLFQEKTVGWNVDQPK